MGDAFDGCAMVPYTHGIPVDPILVCTVCKTLIHISEVRWRLKIDETSGTPHYTYQEVCELCGPSPIV